jgi:hypothetical protein
LDLPKAFRDPIFRPSKTIHVVFDRDVFSAVRGQDLGSVRGQPIRPLLAGLGEPFTDWLFQTAMHARHTESAFAIKAAKQWPHGPGWLLVFALRWLGKARRLSAPDSIVPCFLKSSEDVITLSPTDAMLLLQNAESSPQPLPPPSPSAQSAARTAAQQALREHVSTRDPLARSAANLSLLFAAAITQ